MTVAIVIVLPSVCTVDTRLTRHWLKLILTCYRRAGTSVYRSLDMVRQISRKHQSNFMNVQMFIHILWLMKTKRTHFPFLGLLWFVDLTVCIVMLIFKWDSKNSKNKQNQIYIFVIHQSSTTPGVIKKFKVRHHYNQVFIYHLISWKTHS